MQANTLWDGGETGSGPSAMVSEVVKTQWKHRWGFHETHHGRSRHRSSPAAGRHDAPSVGRRRLDANQARRDGSIVRRVSGLVVSKTQKRQTSSRLALFCYWEIFIVAKPFFVGQSQTRFFLPPSRRVDGRISQSNPAGATYLPEARGLGE